MMSLESFEKAARHVVEECNVDGRLSVSCRVADDHDAYEARICHRHGANERWAFVQVHGRVLRHAGTAYFATQAEVRQAVLRLMDGPP